MGKTSLIQPNGGELINRLAGPDRAAELTAEAASLPSIRLSPKQACDLEMIAIGAFSPLTGFVGSKDFESICQTMRLTSGVVWPIPITLAVDEPTKAALSEGGRAALFHGDGTLLAILQVNEIYPHDNAVPVWHFFVRGSEIVHFQPVF